MLQDQWQPRSRWVRFKLAWRLRRLHLAYNGIWFLLGLLSVITAVTYFVDPNHLLVQQHLTHHLIAWGYAWSTAYGIGGLLMMVGDVQMNASVKALGLSFFSGALLVQALGICIYGFQPGVFTLFALVIAAVARIYALLKLKAFPESAIFPHLIIDERKTDDE